MKNFNIYALLLVFLFNVVYNNTKEVKLYDGRTIFR